MPALPMATAPEKPRWGEPCNGCGFCCAAALCPVGKRLFGERHPAPCPAMKFDGGRFWCGAVALAEGAGVGPLVRFMLGIGFGCDSEDADDGTAAK